MTKREQKERQGRRPVDTDDPLVEGDRRRKEGALPGERLHEVLVPWPRLLKTNLACLYLGGISSKTLRRLAKEHGILPRRIEGHANLVMWSRVDLDELIEKFE